MTAQPPVAPGRTLRAARLLGTLGAVATGAGFAVVAVREHWWIGELAASFDWYLGWSGAVTALVLLAARAPRRAAATAALALWTLAPTLLLYLPRDDPRPGPELRVATINLFCESEDASGLLALLEAVELDVIAFQEVSPFWQEVLVREDLARRFPHRLFFEPVETPTWESFGMMLASRLPLEDAREHERPGCSPLLEARVRVDEREAHVVCCHPPRPGRPRRIAHRDRQLEDLAASIDWTPTSVLLGDLNTHSRSPAFATLLGATELRDSRLGFGRQASWRSGPEILLPGPLRGYTPVLWTDLDHVLVGEALAVADRRVGPDIGSDHRPILATLRITSAPSAGR